MAVSVLVTSFNVGDRFHCFLKKINYTLLLKEIATIAVAGIEQQSVRLTVYITTGHCCAMPLSKYIHRHELRAAIIYCVSPANLAQILPSSERDKHTT